MSKITIIEGNSNNKDNVRVLMVKGEEGASAYKVAVENGYSGTEEEWVNSFLNADNYYNKNEVISIINNISIKETYNSQTEELTINVEIQEGGN